MTSQRSVLSSLVQPSNHNPSESKKYRVFADLTTWIGIHYFKGNVIFEIVSSRNSTGWADQEKISVNQEELMWLTQEKLTAGSYGRVKVSKVKGALRIQRCDDDMEKFFKKGKRVQPYDSADRPARKRERSVTLSQSSLDSLKKARSEILTKAEELKSTTTPELFTPIAGDEIKFLRKLLVVCARQIYKGVHVGACQACTGYNDDVTRCTAMQPDIWRESCKAALFAVSQNILSSVCASNGIAYPKISIKAILTENVQDELLNAVMGNEIDESAMVFFHNHFNSHSLIVCS